MGADFFASMAKVHPGSGMAQHKDEKFNNPSFKYTCHMAVLHWIFRDLGDSDERACKRVSALTISTCPRCRTKKDHHLSLDQEWYGKRLCKYAVAIPDLPAFLQIVKVGDVLITGLPGRPNHSMVVTSIDRSGINPVVNIRGFNNAGTFEGAPYMAYDATDRNVANPAFWHKQGEITHFGKEFGSGNPLFHIAYADYLYRASKVRKNCKENLGKGTIEYKDD